MLPMLVGQFLLMRQRFARIRLARFTDKKEKLSRLQAQAPSRYGKVVKKGKLDRPTVKEKYV